MKAKTSQHTCSENKYLTVLQCVSLPKVCMTGKNLSYDIIINRKVMENYLRRYYQHHVVRDTQHQSLTVTTKVSCQQSAERFNTLMSLMSCCVGVSMGTLLSIAPCMAFAHLMASFSILV